MWRRDRGVSLIRSAQQKRRTQAGEAERMETNWGKKKANAEIAGYSGRDGGDGWRLRRQRGALDRSRGITQWAKG